MSENERTLGSNKKTTLTLTLLGLLISAILIIVIGPERVKEAFLQYTLYQIVIFVLFYVFSWILRGLKFYFVLRSAGVNIGVLKAIGLAILGGFANIFALFQVGDVTRVVALKIHTKKDFGTASSPIFGDMLSGALGLILLVLFLLTFVEPKDVKWTLTSFILLSLMILAMFAVIFFGEKIYSFLSPKNSKTAKFIANMVYTLRFSLKNKIFYISVAISIISWFVEGLSFSALFTGIHWTHTLTAEALGNIVKIAPITPGGVGTFEGVASLYITRYGIAYSDAFAHCLSYHLMTKAILSILGPMCSISVLPSKKND